jgi:uncharacterized protein DUF4148
MNRKSALIVLALAAAAGSAFADDITIDNTPFASTLSRVEVMAQFVQYKQAGVNPHASSYNPLKYFGSVKSREQVQQEFLASREEAQAMTAEDSGSSWLAGHRAQEAGTSLAAR